MSLNGKAAIAGIGATEFSKDSGRSELRLALEAIGSALADAGIDPGEVDGFTTFTIDHSSELDLAENLGVRDIRYFTRVGHGGGGGCALLQQAALAIHAGVCEVVVCYRAMNERSQYRFGAGSSPDGSLDSDLAGVVFHGLHGLRTPAAAAAMVIRRYMHEYGADFEDFGRVAVAARAYAATNPHAWFHGKPLSMEEYLAAPMIADPLRLYDCCQESDGGVAFVVVSAERARDLRHKPVLIRAAAQGAADRQRPMQSFYRDDITNASEARLVARQLYAMSGLTPADMDLAILYDHFGPTVLLSLEAYGFCASGEARDFIRDGHIGPGGTLPVNTHGGQVGEAYIHGMNGIAEAVRQLRGVAVNQVEGARAMLVTSGMIVPTSGAILSV